jgi:hypothetical protein
VLNVAEVEEIIRKEEERSPELKELFEKYPDEKLKYRYELAKKDISDCVDRGEGLSPELKELFKKYPEKKEAYKLKVLDCWGMATGYTKEEKENRCKYCRTCMFAHGEPPWADAFDKAHCLMYPESDGVDKPNDVYFDGAPCDYYEREKRKSLIKQREKKG